MTKTIMTVDDSATIRQMVRYTLDGAGYCVIEAADGMDALGKFEAQPVHMLITDLNMPRMDGLELIRRVRATTAGKFIPIIMLTTESTETRRQAGRTAGASGWIVKPFSPDQLLAVIRKLLD